MSLIEIQNLEKIYRLGEVEVPALRGISLSIEEGEFVAIMGASGSGKSTLMNILGCLDRPTRGTYQLGGIDVVGLSRRERAKIRNHHIGFIFQGFNLLHQASAVENVELPLIYNSTTPLSSARKRRERALAVLQEVGLGHRVSHHPRQLSGGEQQRVAIARALVNHPALILADEPTGNLDSATSSEIMELFQRLNQERRITLILVTHEPDVAAFGRRWITFKDGVVEGDEDTPMPSPRTVSPPTGKEER